MAKVTLPSALSNGTIADASQVQGDLNALLTGVNGVDLEQLTNALAALIGLNVAAGPQMRGASIIGTSQSTSSTTYTTLATPDQVANVVLPTNGLIAVWYQATWQESALGAASAAIFLGTNQVKRAADGLPQVQSATPTGGFSANTPVPLASSGAGLVTIPENVSYSGDVTTGQIVGLASSTAGFGGACFLDAAAGTYTVSVKFKASAGTVTAFNRKLRVMVLPFG